MIDLEGFEGKIQEIRQEGEVYIVSPADVEYYSKCLHLRQEIWNLLGRIDEYLEKAMETLKHLQPFAKKRSVIELERRKYYGVKILVVGHSIYTTWTYRSPEEYKGKRSVSIKEMFDTIFEHKDKIVPLLRKSIRDDFLEIVELVEEIQKCLEMEISREGVFRIWGRDGYEIKPRYADKIWIGAADGFYKVHYSSEGKYFANDGVTELAKFFEVYETIYDILTEAHRRLTEELGKCEERLKQIKEIVALHALAKRL